MCLHICKLTVCPFKVCGGLIPASTTLASCSLPSFAGWGQNIRKARRLVDQDNDRLIRKAKAAQETKAEKAILSVLPISRQMSSYFLESWASPCIRVAWEDKDHNHKLPLFLLLSLRFLLPSMTAYSIEYPFGQCGTAVSNKSPPNPLPTTSLRI